MFDPQAYCLFAPDELHRRLSEWAVLYSKSEEFAAPGGLTKAFVTLVVRKPEADRSRPNAPT
jgi:hypothetical protein